MERWKTALFYGVIILLYWMTLLIVVDPVPLSKLIRYTVFFIIITLIRAICIGKT